MGLPRRQRGLTRVLARLRVHQYALIDEVELELGPGLNVLTGETGAGKSILVDSMALLLGARARTDAIREGADRSTIEGLFESGGEERVVRREIVRDGSNRCWLDGGLATATMLREEGERWVDLHGQHEDRVLVRGAVQRDLLDAFAGAGGLADRVGRAATDLEAVEREIAVGEAESAEHLAQAEYLRSQVAEIEAAKITPGEEEALGIEATRLRNSAERANLAEEAHRALEEDEPSVTGALAALERRLGRLAELDPELAEFPERITAARHEIEDMARDLGRYARAVEHDPARLARIEARRDLLAALVRKHGPTLAEVIERGRAMALQGRALDARAARSAEAGGERTRLVKDLAERAALLADAREAAADRLEAAVQGRLGELGMNGSFRVALTRRPDPAGIEWDGERYAWTRGGLEQVAFLIAPNAGEPPRPLSQIASGGELSRVLLALKAALAEADATPTLIFDEIDAGIGGAVAHRVARQLAAVSARRQVIVVTHLAQIAALAERHLVVEKVPRRGRTVITVRAVGGADRVRELSRLLGGDPEREVSLRHARELLGKRA